MENPLTGLTWLYKPYTVTMLGGLASGEIALTHQAFHQLEPWRAAAHLRELLMDCGVLPRIDKQILLFERWLHAFLPTIAEPERARLLRQFAHWHVLPWLRRRASTHPIGPNTRREAGAQLNRAAEFLDWLATRHQQPPRCRQADLDRWHVEHREHERRALKPFLDWAMRTGLIPRLDIPRQQSTPRLPLTQHHRLALIRRLATDDNIALRARVAGLLVLLYAQPISRIARLSTSDILTDDENGVLLRFGNPPTPVPEPFATLVLKLRDTRTNMRTATNPNSPWLFPGRRAGQPLRPETLSLALREIGMPTTRGRTAATRQLVLQTPAPVIASMLGFHDTHTTRVLAEAGGTWNRYAPGNDHRQ